MATGSVVPIASQSSESPFTACYCPTSCTYACTRMCLLDSVLTHAYYVYICSPLSKPLCAVALSDTPVVSSNGAKGIGRNEKSSTAAEC